MEISTKELKLDVLDYLKDAIKKTPQEFKEFIGGIVDIKNKYKFELDVIGQYDFSGWGECHGMVAQLSEGWLGEDDFVLAKLDDFDTYSNHDIDDIVHDFLLEKYPFFDEDSDYYVEESEDLYEELFKLLESDDEFIEHKKNYFYMRVAEYMKDRVETVLSNTDFVDKSDEIKPLRIYHNKKLLISFGVNYSIS